MWRIPLASVDVGPLEIEAVSEVLRARWLTMGDVVRRFEEAFSARHGSAHAIAVSSCTAALEMAYRAAGVGPGDEVILPSLTFVAAANAAVLLGATPVFCDVTGEHDLGADAADIAARVTPRTRAVCVVHYAGYPCDLASLVALCRDRGLALVEDCAHAPGASYGGAPVGTLGDVGCFSFFSNKNMTTGEGGMILTRSDAWAARARLLRSHGMTTLTLERHRGHAFTYDVVEPGWNHRMDEMRAAIGLVQLGLLDERNARRGALSARYRAGLGGIPGLVVPFAGRDEGSAFHLQVVLLPRGADRGAFMAGMRDAGIQTSIHYPPVHQFSWYRERFPAAAASLPRLEAIAGRLVTLPLHPALSDEDVDLVCRTARALLP